MGGFKLERVDSESGYDSTTSSSSESLPEIYFTPRQLKYINSQLQELEPQGLFHSPFYPFLFYLSRRWPYFLEILKWCLITLPNLFQTTAFGLTGLVTIDMLSHLPGQQPPLIFLDTLHHFPETLDLVRRVQERYPTVDLHVFKPKGTDSATEFAEKHGEKLWETNGDLYDFVAKVEPAQRAYKELNVRAVLTGRRRSQGGKRGDLDIVEVDDAGLIKVNPLANWSFQQVKKYVDEHNVPYNVLLDRGYKSVGDWHSTV
jgi:phosphoadenosine phosphosulfate reductase